jgi:hypothetical protein
VGEAGDNNDQQRFSEIQRQHAHCGSHTNPARGGLAARVLNIIVPARFSIVERQATNVSAVKSNKVAKRAHAPILAGPVGVGSNAGADRFQRSLSEQAIDKRRRSRMIKDEPVVSRQSHPEPAQIREVDQTVA